MSKEKMVNPVIGLENIRLELPTLTLVGDKLQDLLAGAPDGRDGTITISMRELENLSGTLNMSLGRIEEAVHKS
ncbi:MAG: hypothetical protein WDL87_01920 [Candidatus Omnitrophota bacterium]|jgi:hypothetical protein